MTQHYDPDEPLSQLEEFEDDTGLYAPEDVDNMQTRVDNEAPDAPDSEDGNDLPTRWQYCLTEQVVLSGAPMVLQPPPHEFGHDFLQAEDWQIQTHEFTKVPTAQGGAVRGIAVLWAREVTFDPDAEPDEQEQAPTVQQPVLAETREYLPVQGAPRSQYPTGNPADTASNAPGSPGGGPVVMSSPTPAGAPAGGSQAVKVHDRGVQPIPEGAAEAVAANVAETQAKLAERGVQWSPPAPQAAAPPAPAPTPQPVAVAHSSGGHAPKAVRRKTMEKVEPIDVEGESAPEQSAE